MPRMPKVIDVTQLNADYIFFLLWPQFFLDFRVNTLNILYTKEGTFLSVCRYLIYLTVLLAKEP